MKYNPKLINFFKRHNIYDEEMFKYLQNNSIMIDYYNEEQRIIVGCVKTIDRKGMLKDVFLFMPYIEDKKTFLASINVLTHGIEAYKKLGRIYEEDITSEALPLLYEKVYLEEEADNSLRQYAKKLDDKIRKSDDKVYKIGLLIRDELFKEYEFNMDKMSKKAKKLAKKYR